MKPTATHGRTTHCHIQRASPDNTGLLWPFQPSKSEFKLLIVYALFVSYGSLYPFNFDFKSLFALPPTAHFLLYFDRDIGDIASNLILFMPFGFLAIRSMRPPLRPILYSVGVVLLCVPFAYVLQWLQIFLPSRVPSYMDVVCNVFGCALASVIGGIPQLRFIWGNRGGEHWRSMPLMLCVCWIGSLLVPFIPSIETSSIKDSLKPLLLHPSVTPLDICLYAVGWTAFAWNASEHLGRTMGLRPLLGFFGVVLAAKVFVVEAVVTVADVLGAGLAWSLWLVGRRRNIFPAVLLTGIMLFVTLRGLAPFDFVSSADANFHWLPLYGSLTGDLYINVHMLLLKLFLYGNVIWLLEHIQVRRRTAIAVCLIWIGLLEIAQLWFRGHTPESTDLLLVLLIVGWLALAQRHNQQGVFANIYQGPERRQQSRKEDEFLAIDARME